MTITFTPEEAAEIIRQHAMERFFKNPQTEIRANIRIVPSDHPQVDDIVLIEVWDEEVG